MVVCLLYASIASVSFVSVFFFFQAEDGIRDAQESRGLGDVYKRQVMSESQEKMRFLRHDFRKHLNKLRELSCYCSNKPLQDYLCQLEGAITESKEFSRTGNNDIDCLMNYELTLASEAGTEIATKPRYPLC